MDIGSGLWTAVDRTVSTVVVVLWTAVDRKEQVAVFGTTACRKALTCIGHYTVVVAVETHKTADAAWWAGAGCLYRSNQVLAVVGIACYRDNQIHTAETPVSRMVALNGQTYLHTLLVVGVHFVARLVSRRKDSFLVMFVFGKTSVADNLAGMGTGHMIPNPASGSWWVAEALAVLHLGPVRVGSSQGAGIRVLL